MPAEEDKKFSRAEGYERYLGPWSSALAPRFIDFAGVRDGDRVLDVGSGTGALTLALAASKSCPEIIGIDPSAPFIEFAHTRTSDPRIRFQVEDAVKLPFADGAFDKSLAQLVFNSIPDPRRAAQEMRRVTKPGGIVAACVWSSGEKNEREQAFWGAAMAVDPTAGARREVEGKFSKAGRLSALWNDCGLKEIEETELTVSATFASFEDYWLPYLEGQGHGGSYAKSLSRNLQETLRERVRQNILGTRAEGSFSLRAQAVAVRGIC
jgi:ubiquinone/menaquinone biosynthesis C-methylase UbiE